MLLCAVETTKQKEKPRFETKRRSCVGLLLTCIIPVCDEPSVGEHVFVLQGDIEGLTTEPNDRKVSEIHK